MISLSNFLQCVQENVNRVTNYELGGDGSNGKCDCIGLIIGALALAGFRWPGVHGSNWAARNAMSTLERTDPWSMFLGEIVYKDKEPGESGYSLPERYRNSGDLRDYYHVGVVTSVTPLEITHCTSVDGGIKRDSKMGNWRWGGKLKYVDYSDGLEEGDDYMAALPLYQAVVTATTGKTVRLRQNSSEKAKIVDNIKIGETVGVLGSYDDVWDRVSYNGKTGYMMNKFLRPIEDSEAEDQGDGDTVTIPRELLETWADALERMAQDIWDKLGRG